MSYKVERNRVVMFHPQLSGLYFLLWIRVCNNRTAMIILCCSVVKSCPTVCNPMACSAPGFLILHYLPKFAQIHVHWVGDTISSSVAPFSSSPQSFPAMVIYRGGYAGPMKRIHFLLLLFFWLLHWRRRENLGGERLWQVQYNLSGFQVTSWG